MKPLLIFKCSLIFALIVGARAVSVSAADKVVLQRPQLSSRASLPCQILDYTQSEITVRLGSQGVQSSYPAEEVLEVRTVQTEAHQRGLKRWDEGKVTEAVQEFEAALALESRAWVRREILALLVRCYSRLGNRSSAGWRFLSMVESNAQTRHFELIPLSWAPEPLDPSLRSDARIWLANENSEAARLLGAGLLFDDADYATRATSELQLLSTRGSLRVRRLAAAQLWREQLRSAEISRLELERWQNRINAMPSELRGGPYYLLGQGYERRRELERAARAYLWLPLVYDQDHQLSARACLQAADALASIGQLQEAAVLYREITARYDDTVFAQDANAALKALATPPTASNDNPPDDR